jgi:hypothetical protein
MQPVSRRQTIKGDTMKDEKVANKVLEESSVAHVSGGRHHGPWRFHHRWGFGAAPVAYYAQPTVAVGYPCAAPLV